MKYITVSTLNRYLKSKFDKDENLQSVYLKGEISNFKNHSSGHLYFSLKDEKSVIKCVMFRSSAQHVNFNVQNGSNVLILGKVGVYEVSRRISSLCFSYGRRWDWRVI